MTLTDIFNFFKPGKTDSAQVAKLSDNWERLDGLLAATPETVNGVAVTGGTRNIQVDEVPLADNLTSDKTQYSQGYFIERTSGGSAPIEDGSGTLVSIMGNQTHTGVVNESITLTVTPAEREEGVDPITATIDNDTFKSQVTTSGTTSFFYSSGWNLDPATYGITVTGTPINGDAMSVVYVVGNRGTIHTATPSSFVSTGWNLYNNTDGYAKVVDYSELYGYAIDGSYTLLEFATTINGARSTITVVDGNFAVTADGYVFVTGGDATTCIYPTWSDWQGGYSGTFQAYTASTIDISSVMVNFGAGLCRIGSVYDEINFNLQTAISRIQRLAYTEENLAAVIESGVDYDADTSYIYAVRQTPVEYSFDISGIYTVSDHGIEYFNGTSVACEVIALYGNNLKNKLEVDVLTKSQDVLSDFSQITSSDTDKALSAAAGKELNDHIGSYGETDLLCSSFGTSSTDALSIASGKKFSDYRYVYIVLWFNRTNTSAAQNMASSFVPMDLYKTFATASVARCYYTNDGYHIAGSKYLTDTTCTAFVSNTNDECRVYGIK